MLHMRHISRPGSVNMNPEVFKTRQAGSEPEDGIRSEDESCLYFISIDNITRLPAHGESSSKATNIGDFIMLAEVREHAVAGKCLPDGVCGYWVRVFGKKTVFSIVVSLWTKPKVDKSRPLNKEALKTSLFKIGEVTVDLKNSGPGNDRGPRKKKVKLISGLQPGLREGNLKVTCHLPTFCSKETYIQIAMCLSECRENGKYDLFEEMYTKFNLRTDEDNAEQRLFLWLERSLCLAVQGKFPEAKRLLQEVVESVPRSPNRLFLLNRAYLYLTSSHIMEGNYGTAEECLLMLQEDTKNGMFYEDMGHYYLSKATILLRFGKNIPRLSQQLWSESLTAFQQALINFNKCLPLLFNSLCRAHINMAILVMYQTQASANDGKLANYDAVFERLKIVEQFGMHKLSERVKCLLGVVKGELYYIVGQSAEAAEMLLGTERLAKDFSFAEERTLSEHIQSTWALSQYDQFMDEIDKNDENDESMAVDDPGKCLDYDADRSAS